MHLAHSEENALISSIFSDGTETFRQPAEPNAGDVVKIRLRIQKDSEARVTMLRIPPPEQLPMKKVRTDEVFDWFETELNCWENTIHYSFLIEWKDKLIHFNRLGARFINSVPFPAHTGAFHLIPGFHVPKWSKGALQYQILPDRFRNGNPKTDVCTQEYAYARGVIRHASNWNELPLQDDYRCQYGGDLVGVMEKLDYLQSLGVEAIYLNPIFVSPSPHRYDTQDYDYVDPHLTVIPHDGGEVKRSFEKDNSAATKYILRTTDPENLEASNEWFASFCQEVHRRGMKLILDGVFNHCGSFHRWMNREHIYPGNKGAYGHPDSPYRDYFTFHNDHDYYCWWDIETLPKLCYEKSAELCENIFRVAEKWASPPYSIDGWRLDVAADLGQSRDFNHLFWKEFRRRVKDVNPEVLIIAEHYGDPAEWLEGGEWDTVMNYDAFMEPLTWFLTGMEKHSEYRRDDLFQNGEAFFDSIFCAMSRMPTSSVYCAMDELSNHDHSRFMTRTNGRAGRLNDAGSAAASEGIRPEVFREAATIQMTWPGAPTIYYGDEAGLTGWTDPDNRRTYPWGREDQSLIDFHRDLAKLRSQLPVLKHGSLKKLCAGWGHISYARFDETDSAFVACNNTESEMEIDLPLRSIGIPDGTLIIKCFDSNPKTADMAWAATVSDGFLRCYIPAHSTVVYTPAK